MKQNLILDILEGSKSLLHVEHGYYYKAIDRSAKETPSLILRSRMSIKNKADRMLDKYEVKHGLTDTQIRILFKIVAKEYDDCGRKRGAILRYIKHFEEVEAKTKVGNLKMYNILRCLDKTDEA